MILKIFLIRDTAVESFLVPMFFPSEGAARRAFGDEVNRVAPDNNLNKHPEHFQLYDAGIYDDATGIISSSVPVFVVDAQSVLLERS